jgi:CheY-like chemotaxis protein
MSNRPGTASIMLLISDPDVRTAVQEILQDHGYLVQATASLGAAVDRLKEDTPDLLIIRPYGPCSQSVLALDQPLRFAPSVGANPQTGNAHL